MGDLNKATQNAAVAVDEAIQRIRSFTATQIRGMARLATNQARRECLHSIASCVDARISSLSDMVHAGLIFPQRTIRLAESSPPWPEDEPEGGAPLRVGVYPVAANPLHWGHLLVGLTAQVSMRLDKVIFVIAGRDSRKPSMPSPEIRHRLARDVVDTFQPFLAYSPIALGTDLDGETNLGRILALNSHLALSAFYVAGADHYRRRNERNEPDTLEKLERITKEASRGNPRHTVSVVFLDRPDHPVSSGRTETFVDVHLLPAMPFVCSSSLARHTLCGGESSEGLACLPYATLAEIRSLGLYDGARECSDDA